MNNQIKLEIGDFLGFCDLNGIEALQSEQIEKLENFIQSCNDGLNNGEEIVADAIYDRLMQILRAVNPESDLCRHIWEDSVEETDDTDRIFANNPMYSIMTVKSFDCDEIKTYVKRLPSNDPFDAHLSMKLNGHGIRLKYRNGEFFNARSRARSSAGRDITEQLRVSLEECGLTQISNLEYVDLCEVRGEWVLPMDRFGMAREYNPDVKSPFSAVASLGAAGASEDQWRLLKFIAYEFLADGVSFGSKEEEYAFLTELGFEVPLSWLIPDLSRDTLINELENSIIPDCESEAEEYNIYTDGIVFSINDNNFFRQLGDDGTHYKFGNMALKVGVWKQDMYSGYVQTILWERGKTKLTPVAIIAEDMDAIEFTDYGDHAYIDSKKMIANYDSLGVVTASGNKVRRVPLYEPYNIAILDAYKGGLLYFRYGGEAGVVPCFEDGKTLVDGKIAQVLDTEVDEMAAYEFEYEE